MPSISSLGVGSGLDLGGLVQQLVAAEAQAPTLRLDRREANFQSELSALGIVKSALSGFQSAQKDLISIDSFQPITATSGNEDIFSVETDEGAQIGNHSVEVRELAEVHRLASKAFSNVADSVGSGTLTFRFGTYDSVGNTFSVNPDKSAQAVTIDPSNDSLSGIRDAVNEANIGLTASIVDDGTGQRLVFSSVDTGTANSLEITVNTDLDGNDTDDAGLSQLAYDPTAAGVGSGKNLTETVTAKDALLVVDGLTITRSSNTVTGAVPGVTLELKSAALGTTTSLSLDKDLDDVSAKVNAFVDGFNELIQTINQLTSYNPETRQAGPLQGDSAIRGLEFQLRKVLTGSSQGLTGSLRSLADIGISTQNDGTLALDDTLLQSAIEQDAKGVARLFAESGSVSDSLVRFSGSKDISRVGEYAIGISQLATQGSYSGGAVSGFPLDIDSTNDTFSIKVDGAESSTISLTQGTYSSAEALAAELQSRINGDANLSGAGVSVQVTLQSSAFEIKSSRYGSGSSVEITAIDTNTTSTIGLSIGAGTAGTDVVGTIGGQQAVGSGQTLTGIGAASGLSIDVLGGALGFRGNLSFARGVASGLDTLLSSFLGTDNIVDSRIDSLTDRITDIGEQRETLNTRLTFLEERLRKQFTALDTLVSQLQSTSSFLTQQLASLPTISSSSPN